MTKENPYLAIIDYGCGNVKSILNISKAVGCNAVITDQPDEILNASGLFFLVLVLLITALQKSNMQD